MIVIAGGGVGGLTLALMLHAARLPCLVLEAAAEVRPVGVGINVLPHAVFELAALDLLAALGEAGIETRSLTYANHLGQPIWSEPRGFAAGHAVPQVSIHRGILQTMLWRTALDRLGSGAIQAGQRLTGFTQDRGGLRVRFAGLASPDGIAGPEQEITADALVGADGIHSWLRAALHPGDPGIRWNGITMWRGAVDWPAFDGGDAMVIAGDATVKLVLYPIGPGSTPGTRLTNWVIYARVAPPDAPLPHRESWSRPGRIEDFRPLVERLSLPFIDVKRLVAATDDIFEYPMCDRDPLEWWTAGRVTLLGDAAHPMYPVGSNGASQAILDARCLVDHLRHLPVADALRAYETDRLAATSSLVRSNRIGGPERVIDLVAERAPAGFGRVDEVATRDELAAVVKGYARLAGFAVERRT